MKKEDIEFLKELQNEMLTQDHVSQANPRFWVVMQEVKDYWVNDDADGIFIYSCQDGESVFEGSLEEATKWIKKLDGIQDCKYDVCYVEFIYEEEEFSIGDADDLQSFLDEYDKDNYSVGEYRIRQEIVPNTMFLTNRECKEHIKSNRHHYGGSAYCYAMTAWRSPQVERLYEILENTDWKSIKTISEEIKMNKPKIFTISAKANHGKNTLADFLKLELEEQGYRVGIIAYGDYVKTICKSLYNWNGEKDEVGRTILQKVGTDIVRKNNENFWVSIVEQTIDVLRNEFDYFIIPDVRFLNEIEYLDLKGYDITSIYIKRDGFKSNLTKEQLQHSSENGIGEEHCGITVINNGLEELHKYVKEYLV